MQYGVTAIVLLSQIVLVFVMVMLMKIIAVLVMIYHPMIVSRTAMVNGVVMQS